jgi:hypothetical protein
MRSMMAHIVQDSTEVLRASRECLENTITDREGSYSLHAEDRIKYNYRGPLVPGFSGGSFGSLNNAIEPRYPRRTAESVSSRETV